MDKVEKLDNLQFIVTELVNSIRENIIEENTIKNENLRNLEKDVTKFMKTNEQFCAGHNIRTLKIIIDTLFYNCKKSKIKRIRELESKNKHLFSSV